MLRWLFYRLGWSIQGNMPNLKKYVVAIAPHTSSWDFVIGVMARSTLNLKARYLGKSQLFNPPFGWFFRMLGGTPVDRSGSHDLVEQVVKIFKQRDEFVLGLAPEGTRKKVEKLRTGFYYIAKGAGVPIVPVGFDFAKKQVIIGRPLQPTDNFEADMATLMTFYRSITGKVPELGL